MKKGMLLAVLALYLCSSVGFAAEAQKEQKFFPDKVEADKNYDGTADFAEYFQNGKLEHREADTDFDGTMDEWTYFDENGKPVKTERDTNKDGKPDTWIRYDQATDRANG